MLIFVNIYSLYNQTLSSSGRGEIGKHKGLKRDECLTCVTVPSTNLLINNNNLQDLLSDVSVTQMRGVVTW
jgi:hypothetical protein